MNKFGTVSKLLWLIILMLLVGNIVTIYLLISNNEDVSTRIRNSVSEEIASIDIPNPVNGIDGQDATEEQVKKAVEDYFKKYPVKNGKDGYTPVKGVDYVDGQSIKGDDGYTPVKNLDYFDGQNGSDGVNGLTPQIRCNTTRNIWQVRYSSNESWQPLNGEQVACKGVSTP